MYAGALELQPVGSNVLVGVPQGLLQARQLQRAQLILAGALDRLKLGSVLPGHGSPSSH